MFPQKSKRPSRTYPFTNSSRHGNRLEIISLCLPMYHAKNGTPEPDIPKRFGQHTYVITEFHLSFKECALLVSVVNCDSSPSVDSRTSY